MGTCLSKKSGDDSYGNKDLHTIGLHPGDTPYPVKLVNSDGKPRQGTVLRRPSVTGPGEQNSIAPHVAKPARLTIPKPDSTPVDDTDVELELYDTCPTPYPTLNQAEFVSDLGHDLTLMRIEFISATVDGRNVKAEMDELIIDAEPLHITGGLRTIFGVNPDNEDEIFHATYMHRSHYQLHRSCDKKKAISFRAAKGLQLRITCVSYRGHDYAASANALLMEGNTVLEIPAGKAEEMLKCLNPANSLALDAPFLFTYVFESEVYEKTCGIHCEFNIPKYQPLLAGSDPKLIQIVVE